MEKAGLLEELHKMKSNLSDAEPFEFESRKIKKINKVLTALLPILMISIPLILSSFDRKTAIIATSLIVLATFFLYKSLQNQKERLKGINEQLTLYNEELNDISIIPRYYHNLEAVNSFISYLSEERASTINECRKIFELDSRKAQLNAKENTLLQKEQDLLKREEALDTREMDLSRKENEILQLQNKLTIEQKNNLDLQRQLMQQLETTRTDT